MSDNVQALAEASATHIGGFQPNSGQELHQFFGALPGLYEDIAKDFAGLADRLQHEHVHPNVLETLRDLGQVMLATSDTAQWAYEGHLKAHALWLAG